MFRGARCALGRCWHPSRGAAHAGSMGTCGCGKGKGSACTWMVNGEIFCTGSRHQHVKETKGMCECMCVIVCSRVNVCICVRVTPLFEYVLVSAPDCGDMCFNVCMHIGGKNITFCSRISTRCWTLNFPGNLGCTWGAHAVSGCKAATLFISPRAIIPGGGNFQQKNTRPMTWDCLPACTIIQKGEKKYWIPRSCTRNPASSNC